MNNWIGQLAKLSHLKKAAILVTVIETKGSTPRETAARMIVTKSEVLGSVGGGNLEYQCVDISVKRLRSNDNSNWNCYEHRFSLGASLAQCCGGMVWVLFEYIKPSGTPWIQVLEKLVNINAEAIVVTSLSDATYKKVVLSYNEWLQEPDIDKLNTYCRELAQEKFMPGKNIMQRFTWGLEKSPYLIESINPNDFNIMLFGAGHVGKALVSSLSNIDVNITWVDNRPEQFPELIPDNTKVSIVDEPEDAVDHAFAGTYFLVMTHNHQLDLSICSAILKREDFSYCGLIGSKSKRLKFEKRLLAKDYSASSLIRLSCPIGIGGITSKKPAEIAISVAAELLQMRTQHLANVHEVQSTTTMNDIHSLS